MLSRNRSITPTVDTVDRSSTGITGPPGIPVDGEHLVRSHDAAPSMTLHGTTAGRLSDAPLTSLELLRQLEAFVRELFELSSSE